MTAGARRRPASQPRGPPHPAAYAVGKIPQPPILEVADFSDLYDHDSRIPTGHDRAMAARPDGGPDLPRLPPDDRGRVRQLGRRDELPHQHRIPRARLGPAPMGAHHHFPGSLEPPRLDDLEPQLRHGRPRSVGLSPRQPPPALRPAWPCSGSSRAGSRDRVERGHLEPPSPPPARPSRRWSGACTRCAPRPSPGPAPGETCCAGSSISWRSWRICGASPPARRSRAGTGRSRWAPSRPRSRRRPSR